mmetsp:Transcript_16377/g.27718  ORF Transcript_16377/g.27718 Transcript_16377/m.27718 type:complete len:160 (+) Transcript_16377:896-1375(+)
MSKVLDRTNKKMYGFNQHQNSDDFKNLGNLHREKRLVEFFPQDDRYQFSTKPQVLGGQAKERASSYNYDVGGLSYTQRVAKNLVGDDYRKNRKEADQENIRFILERMNDFKTQDDMRSSQVMSNKSAFPKTTNQDFHNREVFQRSSAKKMDKQNFKRNN